MYVILKKNHIEVKENLFNQLKNIYFFLTCLLLILLISYIDQHNRVFFFLRLFPGLCLVMRKCI